MDHEFLVFTHLKLPSVAVLMSSYLFDLNDEHYHGQQENQVIGIFLVLHCTTIHRGG